MLILFILLFFPLLLSFRCRLERRGEPRSKLNDVLNSSLPPVDDHGVLQIMDKLLVEQRLVLQLKDGMREVIKNVTKILQLYILSHIHLYCSPGINRLQFLSTFKRTSIYVQHHESQTRVKGSNR